MYIYRDVYIYIYIYMYICIYKCVCVCVLSLISNHINLSALRTRHFDIAEKTNVRVAELGAAGFAPSRPRTEDAIGGATRLAALLWGPKTSRKPRKSLGKP